MSHKRHDHRWQTPADSVDQPAEELKTRSLEERLCRVCFYKARNIRRILAKHRSGFGRLICWINFSAGAEFLAKGVCLLRGIEIRNCKKVPAYPSGDFATWASQYRFKAPGTDPVTDFGTLGDLLNGPVKELCDAVKAPAKDQELVLAAYELLCRSIRNRDAHAYVPNVRDSHFSLVNGLFTKCLNLLVSWIPYDKSVINAWMDQAPDFTD